MAKQNTYPRRVVAIDFIRRMRGGSQSSLLLCNDGNFYIVKLMGNPQGSTVLFSEALGTELMRVAELSVPMWCPVEISDEFIEKHREIWFQAATPGRVRPNAGIHFGSKLVMPSSTEALYELLPRNWFKQIVNREEFIGALLFDLWANQMDNRQALFLQHSNIRSIKAIFIDQGSLFIQNEDDADVNMSRAMFMDSSIYADLPLELIVPKWLTRIRNFNEPMIRSLIGISNIPSEWYTPDILESVIHGLMQSTRILQNDVSSIVSLLSHCSTINRSAKGLDDDIQLHGLGLRSGTYKRAGHRISG